MSRNTMYTPKGTLDAENDVLRDRYARSKSLARAARQIIDRYYNGDAITGTDIENLKNALASFER